MGLDQHDGVQYFLNGREYAVRPCVCGSRSLKFAAGMMAGYVMCRECHRGVTHNTIAEAIEAWNLRADEMKTGEKKMEFKGYDYGELIDAFGIRDEYRLNADKIEMVESILETLPTFEADELDLKMIEDYIWDNLDDEEAILAPAVKMQMVEYLKALRDEEHVSNGTFLAADMLLELAKDEDDMAFVAWFCLMLPRLWT